MNVTANNTITLKNYNHDALFESALLELDKLMGQVDLLANKDLNYLLKLWGWFSIYQMEPAYVEEKEDSESGGSVSGSIRIKGGWKILDYGDGLITSAGEHYGSYSTGALLKTVRFMVECLAKRGAKTVIFSGTSPAQRVAWIECERYGINNKFVPNKQDIKCHERWLKTL
jgi:hypothetical protein